MEIQKYAGFWIRLGAILIDTIILLILTSIPLTLVYGKEYWISDTLVHGGWDILISWVLPMVVTIWLWLRFFGTPGKMLLELKIVDEKTGSKISLGQAIGRYFGYIVSLLPLGLGFIWIAIDSKKRGFHDILAGTVVIKTTLLAEFEEEA